MFNGLIFVHPSNWRNCFGTGLLAFLRYSLFQLPSNSFRDEWGTAQPTDQIISTTIQRYNFVESSNVPSGAPLPRIAVAKEGSIISMAYCLKIAVCPTINDCWLSTPNRPCRRKMWKENIPCNHDSSWIKFYWKSWGWHGMFSFVSRSDLITTLISWRLQPLQPDPTCRRQLLVARLRLASALAQVPAQSTASTMAAWPPYHLLLPPPKPQPWPYTHPHTLPFQETCRFLDIPTTVTTTSRGKEMSLSRCFCLYY